MISIYQGNDKAFVVTRTDMNGNIITTRARAMWFTVKAKYTDIGYLFQKKVGEGISQRDDGKWVITINAEDTALINPGRYVCDVKILNEQGREYTIVKPQEFVIMSVVTQIHNQKNEVEG